MADPGEGSTFRNVFYALGYALGEAEARPGGETPPETPAGRVPPGAEGDVVATRVEVRRLPPAGADAGADAGAALGAAAMAWLLTRLFRPQPVRWHRAVLAGLAGAALADLTEPTRRRLGMAAPAAPPPDAPLRYAAAVATAAAYASLLYPRLPGAPSTRGLIFGALEAAATRAGGTFALLRRLSPRIALPVEALGPAVVPARGPLSALAFGLGLGLYRGDDR